MSPVRHLYLSSLMLAAGSLVCLAGCSAEPARLTDSPPMSSSSGSPARPDHGRGAGEAGDRYDRIVENEFRAAGANPLSTFSIDVDTASYAKVRMYLMQQRVMPNPDAVRIEELVNYFVYDYEPPTGEHPFAAHVETAQAPWKPEHRLVRIGIKGKEIEQDRPASNVVFLLDVSGSMNQPNKLPPRT